LFHICLGAGINPFHKLNDEALLKFFNTADDWFDRAALISDDHMALNQSLVSGEIDFYIGGRVYTVSEARLAGHDYLQAITPTSGCIDGRGGIVLTEITSVLEHPHRSTHAVDFLENITQPEIALRIAVTANTLNPVAQLGDLAVLNMFSKQQLDAIQRDTLSADIERCEMYRIPPNHTDLHIRLKAARDKHW